MGLPLKCARVVIVAVVSAGWVVPACLSFIALADGLEQWLFSIRTDGSIFKVSRFLEADQLAVVACAWLGLVVAGWAALAAWRMDRGRCHERG